MAVGDPSKLAAPPVKEPYFLDPWKWTVVTPGGLSLFVAFFATLPLGALAPLLAWFGVPMPDNPYKIGFAVFVFVFPVVVLVTFLLYFHPKWIGIAERVTGQDLDGKNGIGNDSPHKVNGSALWVMHSRKDKHEMSGKAAPIPHREYHPVLAEGLLNSRPFSQPEWKKEIPEKKFYDIQKAFIAQGLVDFANGRDKSNGYVLNDEGMDTCETILAQAQKDKSAPLPFYPPA